MSNGTGNKTKLSPKQRDELWGCSFTPDGKKRCWWAGDDPLYVRYHDLEWGRPVHEDRKLFEMLILEGAQAGLSWLTILRKRENYRRAFRGFDPRKIAAFDASRRAALMRDVGIVRNRLKIAAAVENARAFLRLSRRPGDFDRYVWSFVGGKTVVRHPKGKGAVPASTAQSDALSRDLKERGFRFVGSTICYAFMQACGLVDDHVSGCFRAAPEKKAARIGWVTAQLQREPEISSS